MTAPVLVTRAEIDDDRWDLLIENSGQSVVYGYSWYLDSVCEKWQALVWPSKIDYQIVMPLPIRKKWYMDVVQQPLFCQYLGLFSFDAITDEQLHEFLKKFSSSFLYISSYSFHPALSAKLTYLLPKFEKLEFRKNHTFWLSLTSAILNIRVNYSDDRKKNLKKSEDFGWSVEKTADIKSLIYLFKNNHASKITGGVSKNAYIILDRLFEALRKHNAAEVWYTLKDNEIHAGVLFARLGKTIIYLFNASDEYGRQGNARTFLLDQYFKLNAEEQVIFDFESPEIETISSFYSSFGSDKIPYFSIRKNDLLFPFKQIQDWRVKRSAKTIAVHF